MSATEVAHDHYADRQRLAKAVEEEGVSLWEGLNPADLDAWSAPAARLLVVLAGAQRVAAGRADDYLDAALSEQGITAEPAGRVNPAALTGVASDGRALDGLLWSPVVATKTAIAEGVPEQRAMGVGEATLSMILRTQVADAGRVADGVGIAARPGVGYVRMLRGKTCSRCAILAGRFYRYNDGFQRHPRCDCFHVPSKRGKDENLVDDPKEYFESLSKSEQDRIFTKAGAQAIRDGADMNQVVNARRGMSTAGRFKTTLEGTSRRGFAGQRLGGGARLMPESIYELASSREDAIRLLRRHGYIV